MKLRKSLQDIKPYVPGKLKVGAIKLASNENPLGPSPLAVEAIKELAAAVHLYPDGACTLLKEKLSAHYGLNSDQVIVGNGSDEILLFIAGAYIEDGTNAVTSESTFSEYTFATKLFGGLLKYAPLKEGTFDLEAILQLIDQQTRVVFLCNPNNPTGTYFTGESLISFMQQVPPDVLVVIDEAYYEYVSATDYPSSLTLLGSYDNLLILRTFSKIYGLAALRIGYGLGSKAVIADLNKTREPFNVNTVAQGAANSALDDAEFVKKSIAVNEAGKQYLYQQFENLNLNYFKTESNFIFVFIGKDCMQAFEVLMDLGVTIRPMKSFGFNDAIRVTIGTKEQNKKFIACLEHYLKA